VAKPAATGPASSSKNTYQGTWGLFRFVDDGNPQKQPTGEYQLSYNIDGKSIAATIKSSGADLFDKNKTIFRSFKAPQTFLK